MRDIHFPTLEIKSLRSREIQQFVKGLLANKGNFNSKPSLQSTPESVFSLMGFRTCYPKIWHVGILNILSNF